MSRRRRIPCFLLCLALALAVVTGLAEPQPAPAVTGPATIRVIAQRLQTARIDVGRSGQSPGDLEVATSLVYNMRVTPRSIGRFELTCTFVRGVSRVCQGTLRLPKGDIVVGGSMRYQSLFELAVLGGTGLYDNGRGTLTVTRLGTGPTRDLLLVRLLG